MAKSVLQVTRSADGGMRAHLVFLGQGLKNHQWNPVFAGPVPVVGGDPGHLPIPVIDGLHPRADISALQKLRRILRRSEWHLIHAHGWKAGLISHLARQGSQLPTVVTLHNDLPPQFTGWKRWLLRQLAGYTVRRGDFIICVSPALAETILNLYPPAEEKLEIIPNGIDVEAVARKAAAVRRNKVPELQALGIGQTAAPVVGTIARLIPEKGLFELLDAVKILTAKTSGLQLILIGDGPAEHELKGRAERLGIIENVRFLGRRENAAALIGLMDVFVLPSWSEGLPLTVLEAMAVGVPIVATRVGGIPSLIDDGKTGALVVPRDVKALTEAITALLADPLRAREMALAAEKKVSENYGYEAMVRRTAQIYETVLSRSSSGGG